MVKKQVARYIETEHLFSLKDRVLVALSGGADSVALLHILLSLGYTCEAAHCNFHLRGKESDRDEDFTRQLCHKLNITLHTIDFDTEKYAESHKISIEMAARELRYQWFSEIKEKCKASVIAIAHHQDDSVETMILNLIRGTGINGLLGIKPKNKDIVRPLLCVTRQKLIDYLNYIKQDYVTDSTNLQDEYTRNKIRLNLIPLMQEINPSVKDSLINTGNHLAEVYKVYQEATHQGISRVRTHEGIHIEALLKEPSPQALLFEILHPLGFNSAQLKNIYDSLYGQPGKYFISSKGWKVTKDRELLYISKVEDKDTPPPFSLQIKEEMYSSTFIIPTDKNVACLDADKVKNEFTIRKWEHGDTFIPLGMKGRKKVSDYLTDKKFSLLQKENQWVLCNGNEIVWLIGERLDNRYRITPNTRKIYVIKQISVNKVNF
ncbi:tRNA lysidine(34) synthetase TilS [Bacteroides sp. 224]|uniref:tRNA lysidine(34) synthetase TilS n=1 Tax=Bacteroides sp. 224 TaxID=2302936 RepID=UPI0013D04189|nr:tRNA lysidine(34) synthetase TilS [Bacteroides sp. 224]NDV65133.1 tRNA lysidine(34) synthetase TilS [Bacteroides sp. 224]